MYAFNFQDKALGPDGPITDMQGVALEPKDSAEYNRAVESQEIDRIKAGEDKLFLYIGHKPTNPTAKTPVEFEGTQSRADVGQVAQETYCVQTWLGTWLGWVWLGDKSVTGFQGQWRGGTYRRAVTVRMFGTLYHGWFYESSGDYCRLKKAKRQDGRYAASRYYPPVSKNK